MTGRRAGWARAERRSSGMDSVRHLQPAGTSADDESPLARARLHRQLTVDEAARRAGVAAEEVQWLEEGRLYRFPSPDRALLVTVLVATALGIDHREALELAGLPVPPKPLEANPWLRLGAVAAIGALVVAAALAVVLAMSGSSTPPPSPRQPPPRCLRRGRSRSSCSTGAATSSSRARSPARSRPSPTRSSTSAAPRPSRTRRRRCTTRRAARRSACASRSSSAHRCSPSPAARIRAGSS